MKDLVFVKFNSRLKHKKDNKDRDPIEKPVLDALEDEDNEWITGIEPIEGALEGEGGEPESSSQGVAAVDQVQEKRKGGNRTRKRKRLIPSFGDEDKELSASSSDEENDMQYDSSSDSLAE
jgi:hypothetical protein